MKRTKIFHGEFLLQSINNTAEKLLGGCSEYDVINIKKKVDCVSTPAVDEQGGVRASFRESQSDQISSKPTVPSAWCLFQTIQGLVQLADMIGKSRISETCGLRTVDGL